MQKSKLIAAKSFAQALLSFRLLTLLLFVYVVARVFVVPNKHCVCAHDLTQPHVNVCLRARNVVGTFARVLLDLGLEAQYAKHRRYTDNTGQNAECVWYIAMLLHAF